MQNFFFRRCGLNKRMLFFCRAFFLASLLQKHERTLNKKLRYCPSLVVKWITGAVRNYLLLRPELKSFLKQVAQRPRRFQNNFFALLYFPNVMALEALPVTSKTMSLNNCTERQWKFSQNKTTPLVQTGGACQGV